MPEPLILFFIFCLCFMMPYDALFLSEREREREGEIYDDELLLLGTSLHKMPWSLCEGELLWGDDGVYLFLRSTWGYFKFLLWHKYFQ